MIYCDAHFHLIQCIKRNLPLQKNCFACTCAHEKNEFIEQEKSILELNKTQNGKYFQAFGLHPQNPLLENIDFLEMLLKQKRVSAIGEMGFDFYTNDFKLNRKNQEIAWNAELELALFYNVPIILHIRRSMEDVFKFTKKLKKLPAVVFHSFPGSMIEANSFLNRGLNAYFSFGKQILNGNKKAIFCVSNLSPKKILLETDSPFQTLKNEANTFPNEIKIVYEKAAVLRNLDDTNFLLFQKQLFCNFTEVFQLP